MPVLPSLGRADDGSLLNVNADAVASHLAASLDAAKLVLLTGVAGVMENLASAGPISQITVTAARELVEETGYHADSLNPLHEFYSAPGICDELMHLFVARELTPGSHQREATETIENRVATRDEVTRWIGEGRIRDAKSLVGLYAFLYAPALQS